MKKDMTAEEYLQRVLTSEVRGLERLGIVRREQFNEIPPHVEYSLTEKGRALLPVFCELAKWGESFLEEDEGQKNTDGSL